MRENKARNPAMDVIRCVALFSVIAVHFFLNSGFYDKTVWGLRMYIMVLVRTQFLVCVPLFLLLSGYLMGSKLPSGGYYTKIIKTICIYVLACVCCGGFSILRSTVVQGESASLFTQVKGIFAFTTAPYSWYVEMYLGLFCLIPFLNVLYNNLPSQKEKRLLICVLLLTTAAPGVLNIYRFCDPQWWLNPGSSKEYHPLVPNWWVNIYPMTYYFVGRYLKEYPVRLRKSTNLILIGLVVFILGTFCYYRSYGTTFIRGEWQAWASFAVGVLSVLVFLFLSGLNYERVGQKARYALAKLSDWCFGAYLVSWIFDEIFYGLLADIQPDVLNRFYYFGLIVPAVFVCSLGLSAVLNLIYNFAETRIVSRREKAKP